MAQNIKINGVTFTDVDYIQVPKADGSGVATYRDLSNFHSALNINDLIAGTVTEINDIYGEVTGNVSSLVFYDYDPLVSVNFPKAISTSGTTFQGCGNLETVKMPSCVTTTQSAFRDCPKLTLAELDNIEVIGANVFQSDSLFGTLVVGKTNVPTIGGSAFNSTKIASGTGTICVYADWISLFRTCSTWISYATQMILAETHYDPTALEYDITVTSPTGYKPYVTYTTSKGSWYGRDRAIAGGSTDTLTYIASCPGLVDKIGTVSIDSGSSSAISLDVSDMVIDTDFNGFNIANLDFTNAEVDFSNNCSISYTNFTDWFANIHSIKGVGGFLAAKYFVLSQTIPSTSGMSKPTVVWEVLVNMAGTGGSTRHTLYNCGNSSSSNTAMVSIGASDINLQRSGTAHVIDNLDLTDGWHHIGIAINSTNSYVYVDGELKLTVADTGMYTDFTTTTQRIGNRWVTTSDYFLGRLKKLVTCIRDIDDPTVLANCKFLLLQEIQS